MYLKSLKITNFRKFGTEYNIIEFVDSKDCLRDTIDISSATTLIVGKNNSGKTTIMLALSKLVDNGKKFNATDFNFGYLQRLLENYKLSNFNEFPYLEFEMEIGFVINNQDLITNLIPFMAIKNISSEENKILKIIVKYELEEVQEFKNEVAKIITDCSQRSVEYDNSLIFSKFLKLINENSFKLNYFNDQNKKIENTKFNLGNLIDIKLISANNSITDNSLGNVFNKIIQLRHETNSICFNLDTEINNINTSVTKRIGDFNDSAINSVLHSIEDSNRFGVNLSSDVTVDKLLKNLIKYEYTEQGLNIPEGQFGLGYANLMSIISKLIEYVEKYPNDEKHSRLNLICIEEPEAFMHPQMQELFIKNINFAIKALLKDSQKLINSQLIITTHSSHILNSKIHTSNSFNNINYVAIIDNTANVINLNDESIVSNSKNKSEQLNNLKFLKKHIKFKVSEIFFSDAIIFVEGITEETLVPYYISENENLRKYYITIINIGGAHGLVYHDLIKLIKIPTLIITDLDIKRDDDQSIENISELCSKRTTNETIKKYNGTDKLDNLNNHLIPEENNNMYITFQAEKINHYYATSFEEAYILQNYDNNILQQVLKSIHPQIYNKIVTEDEKHSNIINNSYYLQYKLDKNKNKSNFANSLLYSFANSENSDSPKLPTYIDRGLIWLEEKLTKQFKNIQVNK